MAKAKHTRKDKRINLVSYTLDTDEHDNPIKTPVKRSVFASEKSIRDREFYAAAAFDMRPEITLVIWSREYKGETVIEFDRYGTGTPEELQLIRTYKPNAEEIELVCSGPGARPRTR